jgi:hypothetical protein
LLLLTLLSGVQDFKFPDITVLSTGFNLDGEGGGGGGNAVIVSEQ